LSADGIFEQSHGLVDGVLLEGVLLDCDFEAKTPNATRMITPKVININRNMTDSL
jgi:hypothetical protein